MIGQLTTRIPFLSSFSGVFATLEWTMPGDETLGGVRYWIGRSWELHAVWLALAGLACFFAAWAIYRRERDLPSRWIRVLLIGIRTVLLVLLAVAAMGWIRYGAKTDLPDLIVAIDISESMAHRDLILPSRVTDRDQFEPESLPSRLELALDELFRSRQVNWEELRDRYNVKLFSIGERAESIRFRQEISVSEQQIEANATSSRLGQGLEDILDLQRGRPTAAIVVWTDGITTEGPTLRDFATTARRNNVPLSVVGIGDELPPADFRLGELQADDVAFVDDLLTFDVKLRAIGMQNQTATVRLFRQGDSTILGEETITVDSDDMTRSVQLNHRPTLEGDFDYVLAVNESEREVNRDNNRLSHRVRVRDETIRVLLVQDRPSYEYRFLKHLLERDLAGLKESNRKPLFELTTVLQDAEPRYADVDESAAVLFPVRREDLFAFDVVILSDVRLARRGVGTGGLGQLELQHLYDFVVERGGGLIVIHGPGYAADRYRGTPIERLLPFAVEDAEPPNAALPLVMEYDFMPTAVGMSFPQMMLGDSRDSSRIIFDQLHGAYWLLKVSRLKPGVLVLAQTKQERDGESRSGWPMAVLQRVGPGRVLTHCFEETYRWRALQGDRHFARYWIQSIRYLSRQKLIGEGRPVELTSNREDYRAGEPVRIAARFLDRQRIPESDQLTVAIENDASESLQIELRQEPGNLDRFVGTVNNLKPGRYEATLKLGPDAPLVSDEFLVRSPDSELERLQLQVDDLRTAAKISQGEYYSIAEAGALWDRLPPGEPVNVAPLPPRDLWNLAWPIVSFSCLFLALITLEWTLRKRFGLT